MPAALKYRFETVHTAQNLKHSWISAVNMSLIFQYLSHLLFELFHNLKCWNIINNAMIII